MAPVWHYLVSRWLNMMTIPPLWGILPPPGHITLSLGSLGIPGISWDPWDFMGSLGFHGIPGIPGNSWDPWDFMGSLGFHGIPGIGISWDLWDSQAANQVQGAGGRGRQPLGYIFDLPRPNITTRNPDI